MDNLYRRGSELNVARLRNAGAGFHWGDIRDPAAFPAGRFDYLIECSAEPSVLAGQDGNPAYPVSDQPDRRVSLSGIGEAVEQPIHFPFH